MRLTAATFATALSLGVIALALPTGAVARSGATVDAVGSASIAHPALDFSAQQRRPRTYTPRTYTPPRTQHRAALYLSGLTRRAGYLRVLLRTTVARLLTRSRENHLGW